MPQLLFAGFPEGAIRIGLTLSILKKESRVTYFLGADNYFSHFEADHCGQRFAIATLISNGHVRASEVAASTLGIPYRTLMNWTRQLAEKGAGSFYVPRAARGSTVFTEEKARECSRLIAAGGRIAEVARKMGVKDSALRKAVSRARLIKEPEPIFQDSSEATTKSQRSGLDAQAAQGMGTACTRPDERMAAALGLVESAATRFEPCEDVAMGGLLVGLPTLCENGLLSGLDRHLSLPGGFYSAMHILFLLGFMALARIRRPEGLRHLPPGELGKVVGLDRVPEVRTLRKKIALMASKGSPQQWMRDLSATWMKADPQEAAYLYVDGHVRVYHGALANLPRRYVSRERLCLRGTSDYWVNDAIGRPFFVVSKAVNDGLASALLEEIVPELLASVPEQPTAEQLEADPLLHRFVVIFDREGSNYDLLSKLWKQRIAAITYRKAVKDVWPENEFEEVEVLVPGGGTTRMKIATRKTSLTSGKNSLPVQEIRRLTATKHQTAIITTAYNLEQKQVAGRMFSRWCQENFFGYMMEHYDIDGLVGYGSEVLPSTLMVINPARRLLDKAARELARRIRKLQAELGSASLDHDGAAIQRRAEQLEDIQRWKKEHKDQCLQRRQTPKKVTIDSLPEAERPTQLPPMSKILTDTVKMIAYRAETALVGLLRKHLKKEEEARALVRELFVSAADLLPNEQKNTLTVRVHRMASPSHDKAIRALLCDLTKSAFLHPQTGARLIYELA
jgi:transposase-like protein